MERSLFSLACLFVLGILVIHHAEGRDVVRRTKYGRVRGTKTRLAQMFLGIPFAAPAERWTAPTKPSRWRGVLDTKEFKPMCYQARECAEPNPYKCIPLKSEDCLYLNIYTPKKIRKTSRKPVMVFIHGGSFNTGTPSGLVYDGQMFAKKGDVIAVNIAYRLGAFGFLVTGTRRKDITGNYGLMDQRLAMDWVKENIANFGGDPDKITIYGQSAGAYSVGIHLTSGKADDLFQQAIIQSAPIGIPTRPMDVAIQQGLIFAAISNCNITDVSVNVSCLRSLPAEDIATYMYDARVTTFQDKPRRSVMPWVPHVDGDEVKANIMESLLNTSFPGKKVIIGTVTEEAAYYVKGIFTDPVNGVLLEYAVNLLAPEITKEIIDLYDVPDPTDVRSVLEEIGSDFFFICPTRQTTRKLSTLDNVYMYSFNQTLEFEPLLNDYPQCEGKVCHSFEVPFVFQSAREEPYLFNRGEKALSDQIIIFWSTFAKYGNPNKGLTDATKWIRYRTESGSTDYLIEFNAQDKVLPSIQGYRSEYCDALDTIGYS